MYLHLGSDAMVPVNKIIGVFELQVVLKSCLRIYGLSLNPAEGAEKYASFVLTDTGGFFSEIAATTLKKRIENFFAGEYIAQ